MISRRDRTSTRDASDLTPRLTGRLAAGHRRADAGTDDDIDERLVLERTWRRPPGFIGWLTTTDHKEIGLRYIVTAFVFFVLAGHARAAHAHPAGGAEKHLPHQRPLQPVLHHARHGDDVPLCRAGHGGLGDLSRAADGRHAQRLVPAAAELQLLPLSDRRACACSPAWPATWARTWAGSPMCRSPGRSMRRGIGWICGRRWSPASRSAAWPAAIEIITTVFKQRAVGHVAQPHAAVRLDAGHHQLHDHLRDAGDHAVQHDAVDGPADAPQDAFLQPRRGRRCAALAAPVLVLRPPRGVHHLHPRDRVCLGDHRHLLAPPGVRIHGAGAVDDRDGVHRVWRLGASHVRHAAAAAGAGDVHRRQPDDRRSQRRADVLLAGDALERRRAAAGTAAAVGGRLHRRLHDRRADRRDARVGVGRPAGARHLLRRRPPALRADRRGGLPALRRVLSTGSPSGPAGC